jgi:hypothetical protein
MTSIDWHKLRVWNGSQYAAFEELTCQLAATEPMPSGSRFIRKGAPDAGVECFWTLPNGEEHGWQAKFFRSPPDDGQWSQIDGSVETAIKKHPQLKQYTICLPVNRADARQDDKKSFLDRWNKHVHKWENRAKNRGMVVTFVFWGDHEIGLRLTSQAHRGRLFYWFNQEKLSDLWFSERIEEAISNVGPRYTPLLNVSLPVARLFDGLARTESFYGRIDGLLFEVKKRFSELVSWTTSFPDHATIEVLKTSFLAFLAGVDAIDRSAEGPIDFSTFVQKIAEVEDFGRACVRSVYAADEATASEGSEEQRRLGERNRHLARIVDRFLTVLHGFGDFFTGIEARLASLPYLLLTGDAGTGKTHLFCDVAMRRIRAGAPTVLLNGIQFTDHEPWSQILQLLGLNCTKEQFLGALDAAAEAGGTRALLMIDALNEGDGRMIWKKHLAGMLRAVARFVRIGVALSVRTSYETVIIPPGLVPDNLIREEHHGFDNHEFEAATAFFRHYRIEQPSVPLLLPEFRNPLFLKLFCEGLRNRGLSRVPSGLEGVTAIFDFFIESVETKLSSSTELDYDPASHRTRRAIAGLARGMADAGTPWLPREDAAAIVDQVLPRDSFEQSLFRHLLSEGVLLEDRQYAEGKWKDVIHFCYERLAEHMIASQLLDDHLDSQHVADSFAPGTPLGHYWATPQTAAFNQGLLDAFAVQLPERVGVELHDVVQHIATSIPLQSAFIESLLWRDPRAITQSTDGAVTAILGGTYGMECRFQLLDALVMLGTKDGHPFNADRLHGILWPIAMADRDAWWSTYLHLQWNQKGAASVLIHWAGSPDSMPHVDDESLFRAATILAWCLSTPNRYVRDKATKALVMLIGQRIGVIRRLLNRFSGVNDPYVAERLYAVALGCAMRSRHVDSVIALGHDVYEQVFRDGNPPADIMLRAYASEIVEESVRRGLSFSGDPSLIRPPYRSQWAADVPSEDELRRSAEATANTERRPGVHALTTSILHHGDFSRYVLGTNGGGVPWSSIALSEPIENRSMRFRFNRFVASLKPEQKILWEEYSSLHAAVDLHNRIEESAQGLTGETQAGEAQMETVDLPSDSAGGVSFDASPLLEAVVDAMRLDVLEGLTNPEQLLAVQRSKDTFVAALNGDQRAEYEVLAAYPDNPRHYDDDDAFDASLVERWILHRVLELGWRSDKHGSFDSAIDERDHGRDAHKPERIGKKYQWIALHECYARLGDNFHFRDDVFADQPQEYRGTWQLSMLRDIDPTCTFTGAANREPEGAPRWYLPPPYEWQRNTSDSEWLRAVEDFPDVRKLVSAVNSSDREEWLILRCNHDWEEPRLGPGRVAEYPFRRMYCHANAYLVSAAEYEVMYRWACQQDFMNHGMPACRDLYSLYYGEFYSSVAFADTMRADPELFGWTRGSDERLPCAIAVPLARYIREASGFDCSIDKTVSLYRPAPMLVKELDLSEAGDEGRYVDRDGHLVAMDTATEQGEPATFAIRRREFEEFLSRKNLRVIWTVLGGKDIVYNTRQDQKSVGQFVLNGSLRLDQGRVKGHVGATLHSAEGIEALGASEI